MYAVIVTGGKQYRVKEGDVLAVEKLDGEPGQQIDFDQVLLIEDGKTILVGTPVLKGAVVRAEILETYKDEKVLVFKKKRRKQYRRTKGHRQLQTKIRVEGIAAEGKSLPAPKAKPKKAAPVEVKPRPEKAEPAVKPVPEKKAKTGGKAGKETAKAAPKKAAAAKKAPAKPRAKSRKTSKE
jgi:large subunit ribosomal protein L21